MKIALACYGITTGRTQKINSKVQRTHALTTFQVSCIHFVSHTLLLEPYQIDRLNFSNFQRPWERSCCRTATMLFWTSMIKTLFLRLLKRNQSTTQPHVNHHYRPATRRMSEIKRTIFNDCTGNGDLELSDDRQIYSEETNGAHAHIVNQSL